ncbi:MAG: carbohydrate ABC transporter permease [Trueperaceae bacterium]|nr:MAG: carbohydrate ABC transporter permease [Trueperaceae bacterium]
MRLRASPFGRGGDDARSGRNLFGTVILYVVLIALALLTLFPFYWMFVLATHSQSTIFSAPPPMWFGEFLERNYNALLARLPFLRNIWNSFYIALMATVATMFFASLAGFAFAMYQFRFKRVLFGVLIASLMIPPLLGIIPYYLIIQYLGWLNTPRALWVPAMASAFGIFLMRQYVASSMPRELLDAGRIDGASEFRIYWSIALPIIRPGLATLGMLTFIGQWNNFLGPLVVLNQRESYTIPVALRTLQGQVQTDWGAVLTGTALAVLPLLIIFVFASKQVIEGLVAGSVKG